MSFIDYLFFRAVELKNRKALDVILEHKVDLGKVRLFLITMIFLIILLDHPNLVCAINGLTVGALRPMALCSYQ